jgi:hypothetical protein
VLIVVVVVVVGATVCTGFTLLICISTGGVGASTGVDALAVENVATAKHAPSKRRITSHSFLFRRIQTSNFSRLLKDPKLCSERLLGQQIYEAVGMRAALVSHGCVKQTENQVGVERNTVSFLAGS